MVAHLYLAVALSAYLYSLTGMLFFNSNAMLLGMLVFLMTGVIQCVKHGFRSTPMHLEKLWKFVVPSFIILFFLTLALSIPHGGAPESNGLPVWTIRETYSFTRGEEEMPRWRFVAIGTCFFLAWHILGMAFAAEQWADMRLASKSDSQHR